MSIYWIKLDPASRFTWTLEVWISWIGTILWLFMQILLYINLWRKHITPIPFERATNGVTHSVTDVGTKRGTDGECLNWKMFKMICNLKQTVDNYISKVKVYNRSEGVIVQRSKTWWIVQMGISARRSHGLSWNTTPVVHCYWHEKWQKYLTKEKLHPNSGVRKCRGTKDTDELTNSWWSSRSSVGQTFMEFTYHHRSAIDVLSGH